MNRTLAVLAFALLALMAVAPAGAAPSTDAEADSASVEIRDLTLTVSDAHVNGAGLPDWSVDRASYTVDDATVGTDSFTVTYAGETHHIDAVQVTIDDVGLILEDVSVGDE